MTERLRTFADKAYTTVAVVAETAKVVAEIVDEVAVGVQKGIDHMQEVYPDLFRADEPVEDEPVHFDTEDAFATPVQTERDRKIAEVQDFLRSSGTFKGDWFEDTDSISDRAVDMAYTIVSNDRESKERMNRVLNGETNGDRFGRL